jgi:hypothetical protein
MLGGGGGGGGVFWGGLIQLFIATFSSNYLTFNFTKEMKIKYICVCVCVCYDIFFKVA